MATNRPDIEHEASRIDALTHRVGELSGAVNNVDQKVDDVRTGIGKLADAMASVVRLEVHHEQQRSDIASARISHVELDKRLTSVERELPGLVETRAWVVRGVLAVVGVVGFAAIGLVLIKA